MEPDTRGEIVFWFWKGEGDGLRHPRRKPFISRCIVTWAVTRIECSAEVFVTIWLSMGSDA